MDLGRGRNLLGRKGWSREKEWDLLLAKDMVFFLVGED